MHIKSKILLCNLASYLGAMLIAISFTSLVDQGKNSEQYIVALKNELDNVERNLTPVFNERMKSAKILIPLEMDNNHHISTTKLQWAGVAGFILLIVGSYGSKTFQSGCVPSKQPEQ